MPSWTIAIAPQIETRAAQRNLRFTAGDAVRIDIHFVLSDTDPAVDAGLATADLTFRIRERGCRRTVLQKTIGDGITVIDSTAGKLAIILIEDDTTGICSGLYDWQIRGSASTFSTLAIGGTLIVDSQIGAR